MKRKMKKRKDFTHMSPKDHEGNNDSRRERTYKSGFTLIELIVVMAVIGILVLLAAPKFLGYTQRAQETKHIHTAKVIETALEAYLINGGGFPDDLEVIDKTLLEESAGKESLIGVKGYITTLDEETYYELTYDFIQKLDVKLSAQTKIIIEANASSAPSAVYASKKGIAFVDKEKIMKGYPVISTDGPPNSNIGYSEEIIALIEQGYIAVSSPEDLNNVRNDITGKYVQVKDIDLSGIENFEPIPSFRGIYNGFGYVIDNLNINRPLENNVGLFKSVSTASILNINLLNPKIIGKDYVGGVAGSVGSDIFEFNNCIVENGIISGTSYIGGIVGNSYGTIRNSYSSGTIEGIQSVGGIVGINRKTGQISQSSSDSNIVGKNYVGGVIGLNNGIVKFSFSRGAILASNHYAGGLVGANEGSIIDSYATGNIESEYDYAGGLAGGNMYNHTDRTRGIVERSFSTGFVKGRDFVGGLIGYNAGCIVRYSRVSGNFSSPGQKVGPIFGYDNDTYITGTNGNYTYKREVINTVKYTLSQMAIQSNFSTWDFENTWEILPGNNHPTLIYNKEN